MTIACLASVIICLSITTETERKDGGQISFEDSCSPDRNFDGITYTGFATAIFKDEITLQRIGRTARKFLFSDFLKNGGYHKKDAAFMYKIADLKFGDIVIVNYDRKNRIETAQFLSIFRRPSGRVPPSRQSPNDLGQWHEMANSWQDLEMHGIPIPERLLPPKRLTEEQMQRIRDSAIPPPIRIPEPLVVRK